MEVRGQLSGEDSLLSCASVSTLTGRELPGSSPSSLLSVSAGISVWAASSSFGYF